MQSIKHAITIWLNTKRIRVKTSTGETVDLLEGLKKKYGEIKSTGRVNWTWDKQDMTCLVICGCGRSYEADIIDALGEEARCPFCEKWDDPFECEHGFLATDDSVCEDCMDIAAEWQNERVNYRY